jgi:glycine betaine/proline transport system permease protein
VDFFDVQFFQIFPLGDWISDGADWLVRSLVQNATWFFDALQQPIRSILRFLDRGLNSLPWPVVVIAMGLIGWLNAGRNVGILAAVGLMLTGFLGYWALTMTTLAMVITALSVSVLVGVPLGIWASRNDRVDEITRVIMDGMQTIHPFVYLVPIVMLFGIGQVPGTIATIIFSLPPIVRLTNLGIRQVPGEVVEAGRAFGSNDRQILFDVQIPLAMPTIMAGLNQTLMLSLSMVVIIALIAGGGLGQEILRSVGRLDIGRAVNSGLSVLILAIVLDRISQGRKRVSTREESG